MKNIEKAKIPFPNKNVPKHPFLSPLKVVRVEVRLSFGWNSQTQIWLEMFYFE